MIRWLLIGAIAGARAITPIAAISEAARRNRLPTGAAPPAFFGDPLFAGGVKALAAGELAGDKLASAPDRISGRGMVARIVSGALSGAALAPRDRRGLAAAFGAAGALAAAHLTFALRVRAMRRFGQKPTGLVEDALVLGATGLLLKDAGRPAPKPG